MNRKVQNSILEINSIKIEIFKKKKNSKENNKLFQMFKLNKNSNLKQF